MARALEIVGERWTLLVVRDAFFGVRRFSDFCAHLDIPRSVLTERLAHLVDAGVLERRADPDRRNSHLYELTESGEALWPVVHGLASWGNAHTGLGTRIYRHARCDSTLDAAGACLTCREVPGPADVVIVPRPDVPRRRNDPVSVALDGPHRILEPLDTRTRRVPAAAI